MESLDRKTIGNLCRLQLIEQKANLGKALFCAGLIVVLSMIVYVGDLEENCANAVKGTIVLSFLIPAIGNFYSFLERNKGGRDRIISASHIEKYISVWLTAMVDIMVWLVMVGVTVTSVLWLIGNYYYKVSMSTFLTEAYSGFSYLSLFGIWALVSVSVLSTIAWKLKGTMKFLIPVVSLGLLVVVPLSCSLPFVSGNEEVTGQLVMCGVYAVLSFLYMVWGYKVFKRVLLLG